MSCWYGALDSSLVFFFCHPQHEAYVVQDGCSDSSHHFYIPASSKDKGHNFSF